MLNVTIKAKGKTWSDLTLAIEEVLHKLREEYLSGMDSNDDGSYSFNVKGQEEAGACDD